MGVSGSQVQGQGLERATVFLNPGDPEIFQVSPFALAAELSFAPKTNINDNDLFDAELLISIFNNYKYLTQEKSISDLFLNILIPSLIRSKHNSDNTIEIPKQLFLFQNERLNFFYEKFISALRAQSRIPEAVREVPELQSRFSFNISVPQERINQLVDSKTINLFIKTMITNVVINFATLPDNRKVSAKMLDVMSSCPDPQVLFDSFVWATTTGDVSLMLDVAAVAFSHQKDKVNVQPKIDAKRFFPQPPLMKFFNPAKANHLGRFILDEFVPESNGIHCIIAASWEYIFATDGHFLNAVSLSDSITQRQRRFLKQPLPQGFASKKTMITNINGLILLISKDQLAITSASPLKFEYKAISYANKKEQIVAPFTSDGTFIYSYQPKGTLINVFALEDGQIKKINSIKLRESGLKLEQPYHKDIIPLGMATSSVLFCDGFVLHFITFEKTIDGKFRHFVRSFSMLDGYHINDSSFLLDIPIYSISFDSFARTYWIMTLLDTSVGFAQYQYNGPISPSSTHLYTTNLLFDNNLQKYFDVSKLQTSQLSWMIPYYLGSVIISLIGLSKSSIMKNFTVFYYLFNDPTIVQTIIDVLPCYFAFLQAQNSIEWVISSIKVLFALILVNLEITGIKFDSSLLNKLVFLIKSTLQEQSLRDFIISFVTIGFEKIFGNEPMSISPVFSIFLHQATPSQLNVIIQRLKNSHLFPFIITTQHFNLFLDPILSRLISGGDCDFTKLAFLFEYTKAVYREAAIYFEKIGSASNKIVDICMIYTSYIIKKIDEFLSVFNGKRSSSFVEFIDIFILALQPIIKHYQFSINIIPELMNLVKNASNHFLKNVNSCPFSTDVNFNLFFIAYNNCFVVLLRSLGSLFTADTSKYKDFKELLSAFGNKNKKSDAKFDPEKVISDVYSNVKNPLNKMIKGEDKKREGRTFLALSLALGFEESIQKFPEFDAKLKPIAQFVYKLRSTLKESKQATVAFNDANKDNKELVPTLKQQYPLFLETVTNKINYLYESGIKVENTPENLKLLSDFISSEMKLSEFTELLSSITTVKTNIIFWLRNVYNVTTLDHLPAAFIHDLCDFFSTDNTLTDLFAALVEFTNFQQDFALNLSEIIKFFIKSIPIIDANVSLGLITKLMFIISKLSAPVLIQRVLTDALARIVEMHEHIPYDVTEFLIVFILLLKKMFQDDGVIPLTDGDSDEIKGIISNIPAIDSFSIPIATAMLMSGVKPLLSEEEVACLFFAESPEYHPLLQYIKASIMANKNSNILFTKLLDFLGTVFCGMKVDVLSSWIGLTEINPSSVGKHAKTPGILLNIACDVIAMFREILSEKESNAATELIQLMISIIMKRSPTQEYIKQLIGVLSILSDMIETKKPHSIITDRKENTRYYVTMMNEKYSMIEGIILPISGELVLRSFPINGDYKYESVIRFSSSLFNHFTIMFNLFSETITAPKSYSDSILSFFTLGCLRSFIADPNQGESFSVQLSSTMNKIAVKTFEFRELSQSVIKLISLSLTNESEGVFSKSPVEPQLKHISFTRYINSSDYFLSEQEIRTNKGLHCFMSTLLDEKLPSYFSFETSKNTHLIFGVIMHSIDLNQIITISYSVKAGVFLMNGEVISSYKVESNELIEFRFDPKRMKVACVSSNHPKRILSYFLPESRCSFYAIVPESTDIKYNCSLVPQTDNMKKINIKFKHVFHPTVLFGRVKTKMFGYSAPEAKEKEQKFSMIQSGIDDEKLKSQCLYQFHPIYSEQVYNGKSVHCQLLNDAITFSPSTLHITSTAFKLNHPVCHVSMSRPWSILSTPIKMSEYIEIESTSGMILGCKPSVACMDTITNSPDLHFQNLFSMPNDIVISFLSGVCEIYKRGIITTVISKLFTSRMSSLEDNLNLFSFNYYTIVDFCISIMLMLEPVKISNYADQKSPIEFQTSILSNGFTCQRANMFDHYTGLMNVIEYVQSNDKHLIQILKMWLKKIKLMLSEPNRHFVTQSNHHAFVTKQEKETLTDPTAAGWIVFTPEFKVPAVPKLEEMVFPQENRVASYSFVPGKTVKVFAPVVSKCGKTVLLPILAHSNESLINSFFELVIAIKYFVLLVKENSAKLPKEFITESILSILSELYIAIVGKSPFFYSHSNEIIDFITQAVPFRATDITSDYISAVKHVAPLAASVSESFNSFINIQISLEEEKEMALLSSYFRLYVPAGCMILDDLKRFALPKATLGNELNDPSSKLFSYLKRALGKYNDLKDFPFYIIIRDWAESFKRYPPCALSVVSSTVLKVQFTTSYIPNSFSLLSSTPSLVEKEVRVSHLQSMAGSKSVNIKRGFAPPSSTFFIQFTQEADINNVKFIGISTKEHGSIEEFVLKNRENFENDVNVFVNMFTPTEDQQLLIGFSCSKFSSQSISLSIDPFTINDRTNKEFHMNNLRAKYLIAFNWVVARNPTFSEDESFAQYKVYVSMMFNVDRFRSLVAKSNTSQKGDVKINRQIGNALRSGVSRRLEDSMLAQFSRLYKNPENFRNPLQPFHVTFMNEKGIDCGGLSRDFTSELVNDIGDQNVGLFVITPNARNKVGSYRECIVPSPLPNYRRSDKLYYTVGALIAISIRTGMVQPFNFPPLFWNFLISGNISIEEVYEIDENYKDFIKNMESGIRLPPDEFQRRFNLTNKVKNVRGVEITINSLPSTISQSTIQRFISQCNSLRLQELTIPMRSIKDGFWESLALRPPPFVTPGLLEYLACGEKTISVQKLKSLTSFEGIPKARQSMFWQVLSRMDESQKRNFLRFATGTTCIPVNATYPFLNVVHPYDSSEERLPSAATCFYRITLPPYSSAEKMYQKFVIAIESIETFELS